MLRRGAPFDGVVISDSLSAGAVSSIAPQDLGVRFIDAGGDICCVNAASYTQPILDGIRNRAAADKGFARRGHCECRTRGQTENRARLGAVKP